VRAALVQMCGIVVSGCGSQVHPSTMAESPECWAPT